MLPASALFNFIPALLPELKEMLMMPVNNNYFLLGMNDYIIYI